MVRESLDPSARDAMMEDSNGGASQFDSRAFYAGSDQSRAAQR